MADYFLDDAANGTNSGANWATCFNTWQQVIDASILSSGANRLFVGADAAISHGAAVLTLTGPTSGAPFTIISSTVGSGTTVSYSKSATNQMENTGSNGIKLDGSFALYGVRIKAGTSITFECDANESFYTEDCTLATGAANSVLPWGTTGGKARHVNLTIDLTADTSNSAVVVFGSTSTAVTEIDGLSFTIPTAYRTGTVFGPSYNQNGLYVSGADFSGFTNATLCEIIDGGEQGIYVFTNCKTAATWAPFNNGSPQPNASYMLTNCGPSDQPTYLRFHDYYGDITSTSQAASGVYRTGGAAVEGDGTAWKVTTTANAIEAAPFRTPWIYGTTTNGTKTFDLYIAHDNSDAAALTNADIWLEVEVMATADSALYTLNSNHRTITATAAAHATDSTSTWNNDTFTYKQKLSVAGVTVGESGLYRARVCVGKASLDATDNLVIDPFVTVS